MAHVFISHSGDENGWADEIHRWLTEDGHDVFLYRHTQDGTPVGDDWQTRLYERLRWADAVICVITPAYVTSMWCASEIGAAQALGSRILPVLATAEPVDDRLLRIRYHVDVVHDPADARERIRSELSVIDGGGGWGWPDDASPYPGLRSFQRSDHRVFFGRTQEITEITARLRSPAERAARAVLTVVGPSGCGKSSVIRAGVAPRIAGEGDWLVLPPVVPGIDPLGGLVRSIGALAQERHLDIDVASLRHRLDHEGLQAISTDILLAAGCDLQCKALLVIDQFEELLTQTSPAERSKFVGTLQPAMGGSVQVLATMRPEFLDAAAKDSDFQQLSLRLHQLRPLTAEALRSVIEEPARVAGLTLEEDLAARLVADTESGDALPLLAFTLEQLAHGLQRGDRLTHRRYDDIGGVRGALRFQADAALEEASANTPATRDDVMDALLSLVTIDEQSRPTKRRVELAEFSGVVADELAPFLTRRLLSTEKDGDRTVVAVCHEAFLMNWPPFKEEIDAHRVSLRARRVVENAANDWIAGGRDIGELLQGRQLAKTIVDTGAELAPEPASARGPTRTSGPRWWQLRSTRRRRLTTKVELNDAASEFLDASMRSDRARRRRVVGRVAAVIATMTTIALVAVVGLWFAVEATRRAETSAKQATAARLLNEAADMLAQGRISGDAQAFQKLIAAAALDPEAAAGGVFSGVTQRLTTAKIVAVDAVVGALAFSPDGRWLAGGGDNGTVRRWDASSGQPLGVALTGDESAITAMTVSSDGKLLTAADDGDNVTQWEVDSGATTDSVKIAHTFTVALSADGQRVATDKDLNVPVPEQDVGDALTSGAQVWDAETGEPMGSPVSHDRPAVSLPGTPEGAGRLARVTKVALSPDGHRLATSGDDDMVQVWNADTGAPLGPPSSHVLVETMVFSPDGKRLAIGGFRGVQLIDAVNGGAVGPQLQQAENQVTSNAVAFSRDGQRLASGGDDNKVRIWDVDTGQPVGQPLVGHAGSVRAVAFSPDGQQVASGADDNTIRIWNADAGRLTGRSAAEFEVAFTTDGQQVVAAGMGGVRSWNLATGQMRTSPITDVVYALSADAQLAATYADEAETVEVWDVGSGEHRFPPLKIPVSSGALAFSADGRRLATTYGIGTVQVRDTADGRPVGEPMQGSELPVYAMAFSPDGRTLASGGVNDVVQMSSTDTGEPLGEPLTDHTDQINDLAFSPDGQLLASASDDREVRLWDVATGRTFGAPLSGHTGAAQSLAFSPDGHLLASGGGDGTVRLWNVATGQAFGAPLTGHTGAVYGVAFSPDGRLLADADSGGTVRIWPAVTTPQMLCDKLTTNMNRTQWESWITADPNIEYRELCQGLPTEG